MVLAHSQGFSLQSSPVIETINLYHDQMTGHVEPASVLPVGVMRRVLSASYILNKFVLGHAAFFLDIFQKFFYVGTDFSFSPL